MAVVQRGLVTALAARRRGALLSALFGAWALRCFTARALEARVRSLRAVRLERALVAGIGGWHLRSLRKVRIARALGALGGILAGYEARAAAAAFYALRQSAAGDAAKERVAQEFAASKLARGVFARLRGAVLLARARRCALASVLVRGALKQWAGAALLPVLESRAAAAAGGSGWRALRLGDVERARMTAATGVVSSAEQPLPAVLSPSHVRGDRFALLAC